jgi:hypothetical protein
MIISFTALLQIPGLPPALLPLPDQYSIPAKNRADHYLETEARLSTQLQEVSHVDF